MTNDEHLPRAGETLRRYLDRAWPGVAAFLNDPFTAFGDDPGDIEVALQFAFLMGSQWRLASDLYDDQKDKRSKGVAARLIVAACLEDARRALRDSDDFTPEEPDAA